MPASLQLLHGVLSNRASYLIVLEQSNPLTNAIPSVLVVGWSRDCVAIVATGMRNTNFTNENIFTVDWIRIK